MRLTLLCHAATRSMREGGFPSPDEGIDAGGAAKVEKLRLRGDLASSPMLAAKETADLLKSSPSLLGEGDHSKSGGGAASDLKPPLHRLRRSPSPFRGGLDDALRDIDHGDWAGRSFAAIEPEALAAWLADPAAGAPGGETFSAVMFRIIPWLEAQSRRETPIVAVTHPTVIRAALAAALGITPPAVMRIDIAPLTAVELSFNRIWRLQAIRPA